MLHQATERRSLQTIIALLPSARLTAKIFVGRISRIRPLESDAIIVDVGASAGPFLIECARLGYRAVGVEPWEEARTTARALASHEGIAIELLDGVAELLPLPSNSVDVVRANSVIEHVVDAQHAFDEAYRVLKPGGIFWFSTASSLCPRQAEIRGFPAFGWYPNALKLRIMRWAASRRPELIGHTSFPAIHWFTPWKARRMLRAAGFGRTYDRWDLRQTGEGGRMHAALIRVIRSSRASKLAADIAVPACSYAAVKDCAS
ncbi:MAG TPA: class I SAM-dependent methyltransferase [Candidatus Baltobacteraceae bacterium]|jgi:2-polyprenyl-6-hydroxyphenyl methylase/3-demethylubiquinone-9 3-methyltransferase